MTTTVTRIPPAGLLQPTMDVAFLARFGGAVIEAPSTGPALGGTSAPRRAVARDAVQPLLARVTRLQIAASTVAWLALGRRVPRAIHFTCESRGSMDAASVVGL